ncbi:hypothetical protein C8D94_101418 [Marinirhabdus gelatinilytica]|uniref:ATP synthase protein I n=2 Tax=Marinirhabdus gelatinilytica TaxID=1703343 RepID=A0A370QJM0_9FLAO|nr:hypothetical protein C8D94_101418 [Marinirhabdus gelatinilytica]
MFQATKFLTILLLILAVTLGLHIGVLYLMDLPLFSDKIVLSYGVNFLLAAFIYIIIQQILKNNGTYAGFVFMAGSALKFVIFFTVFYPSYNQDDVMQKTEFTAFFIPYAVCLILEVTYLSKQLNNQPYSPKNSQDPATSNSEEKKS